MMHLHLWVESPDKPRYPVRADKGAKTGAGIKQKGGNTMKKTLMIVLAVLISIAFVATTFAQQPPAAAPEKATAAPEKAVKTEKPAKAKDKGTFAGVVTNVNAAEKTISVKDKRGEVTLDVAGAKYAKNMKMEDIKVGDQVVVKFETKGGKMTAMHVNKAVKKAKAEKKEAKPEEKAPAPAPAK
jgi:hypothetical protein